MNITIRVRFAPSPTGHLHIGNVRTAILNWIFAKHTGGKFVLRIEDTDVERSTVESEASILEDLRWLGLDWNEGPQVGGDYGPYHQSERLEVYRDYANELLKQGMAFHCYCTPEELETQRKEALVQGKTPRYDGRCRDLSPEKRSQLEAMGRRPAIRFKVPPDEISFDDLVKGRISFQGENIGDFVILRADGLPTYNFACAIDDSLMRISHVIRGDDHVSNTPRQMLIYKALDFDPPIFAHIPMILGMDRTRLSKRHGATSVDEYSRKGYLPEAMINFLSLLSWSSESGDELLTVERLIEEFDFDRISKAPAVFNVEKLNWMNGHYIRNVDLERIARLALPYLKEAGFPTSDFDKIEKIVALVRDNLQYLSQVADHAAIFFQDEVIITDQDAQELVKRHNSQKVFWSFLRELRNYENLYVETFRGIMKSVQQETGVMGRDLWMPIRVALTGKMHGPELPLIAEALGKEKCERFINRIVKD